MIAPDTPSSPRASRANGPGVRGLLAALLLFALGSPALAGQVWTVGSVGSDFPQIQPALGAASDGDLVLVRAGTYAAFSMPDKSLTVVAEAPGVVQIVGQVRVQGLSAQHRVALIDLSVRGNEERALVLAGDAGSVRIRGGTWRGTDFAQPWWGPIQEAVKVDGCADVSLAGCTLQGGEGVDAGWTPTGVTGPSSGGHGLWAVSSQLALHGCTLVGGDGGGDFVGESYAGGAGGHGALIQGGFLYASECTLRGGEGGRGGDEAGCVPFGDPAEDGGDGGDGLRLEGTAHGELLAFQGGGGAGGAGGLGNCGPDGSAGAAGIPLRLVSPSTASTLSSAPRSLSAPGLWRGGSPATLTLQGAPGDLAVLILAPRTAFRFQPTRRGVALLGGFPALLPLGSLDASGSLQVTLTPLDPPAPLEGSTLQLQAWTCNASTGAHLTGPATTALVDSSF